MTLMACVKCGVSSGTETRVFQLPYGEPWTLVFGLLSYRLMRKVHEVDAYFCERCWQRYRLSRLPGPMVVVITILFIAIGLYFSAAYKNDDPIGYLMFTALLLAVLAFIVQRHLRPRVILATEELVKIKVPNEGILTVDVSNSSGLLGLGLGDKRKDR